MKKMLKLIRAVQDRRGIFLTQANLEETTTGHRVVIPQDAQFATLPEERKAFERDSKHWRFAAGGALMVLHCTDGSYALMRYRDAGAPSYGDHWTLGSGLSSSVEDMVHPLRLAVRECIEEFGIVTPAGILLPTLGDDTLDSVVRGAVRSSKFLHDAATLAGFNIGTYVSAEARFEFVRGEEVLTIVFEGAGETTERALIVVDSDTRGIDFLKVIGVIVPWSFAELVIVDGEEDRKGDSLDGVVGAMKIENLVQDQPFDAVFQHGERQDAEGYLLENMTPPLRAVVEALK